MARLTIYKETKTDSTAVSNLFIDEYMREANDAQLKVYLYLLRMMNADQDTSVSDIADKFNHTEKDVIRALKYWEKHQLLDLDFDQDKVLVGIHIRDLETAPKSDVSSFVPLPVASGAADHDAGKALPPKGQSPASNAAPAQDAVPDAPSPAKSRALTAFTKPVYSLDQLREFESRESTSQLLFIAEAYIGKPLTPAEMKTILFFTDELHFSQDLIDYLLQYCIGRGKRDFKYIERVAVNWAEQGIVTPEQAQNVGARYSKDVYDIVKALGSNNMPTEAEASYITRWTTEYQFSKDIILEACRRTVLTVNSNRFNYAEGILKRWHDQNVRQLSDIPKTEETYRQKKKTQAAAPRQYANRFNQFAQNTYDFDALEKELLSN